MPRVPHALVSGACIQHHIAEHQLSVDARQQFTVVLTLEGLQTFQNLGLGAPQKQSAHCFVCNVYCVLIEDNQFL